MVIGVISAVIGIGGGLQNAWHILTLMLFDGFQKIVQQVMSTTGTSQPQVASQMDVAKQLMDKWGGVLAAMVTLKFIAAVVLAIGGLMLCQRRLIAVRVLRIWGVASLVIAGLNAVATGVIQLDQIRMMQGTPGGAPFGALGTWMIVLMSFITFVITAVFPLFILIWMSLRSTRSEVSTWRL